MKWQVRIAPSLGEGFAGTPQSVWGTEDYTDKEAPCVFFGLYGLPDFFRLWRHKGKKAILFAGSDIRHLTNGYWLDTNGRIRIPPAPLAKWINENCDSYVENQVEYEALKKLGIRSEIIPSFLGDVNDYEVSYKYSKTPKLYTSVSGDDFELYGWGEIEKLASQYPFTEFHLYGNTTKWETKNENVIVHGRVSQEQMNEEIKDMQGALRLTKFDGASEIIVKSVLMGQYPIAHIQYPGVLPLSKLDSLEELREPNFKGREWWIKNLNKYPWNSKR